MPTKFEDIYGRAVFRFIDYSFVDAFAELKEAVLQNYLMSAIVDFQHMCVVPLTDYDLETAQFNVELGPEEIEILSLGIAFYWLSAQTLNCELFRNVIHSKNYTSYSPANLLKEMRTLRDDVEKEYRGRLNTYSVRNGSIENLKV